MMRIRIGIIAAAALLVAQIATADGGFMPLDMEYSRLYGDLGAASTEQKGIVIETADDRQALLLQTTYQGPAAEFAWVVPVPGEPREDDVFIASSKFIEHVLSTTEPIVRTHIDTPQQTDSMKLMGTAGMEEAMAPPSPPGEPIVTLHRRMEVGDYDVSVLSATGEAVLVDWLNEHGYATPKDHADVFGHYVQRKWYFVALRVLSDVAEERPVLDDVKPIGIEFPTEELVYPLYISRVSSREKTAMTLVSLTREPAMCRELDRARLPLGDHGKGTSYAQIRREAVEERAEPSAVVEYAGYGVFEQHNADLNWRDGEWPDPASPDLRRLWATRLWTVIDRTDMEDLSFAREDVAADRVVVERAGRLAEPTITDPVHTGDGIKVYMPLVAALVFVALALGGFGGGSIPMPILRGGLIFGGGVLCISMVPGLLQPLVVAICIIAAVLAAITAFTRSDDDGRAGRPDTTGLVLWALLTGAWVAAAQLLGMDTEAIGSPLVLLLPWAVVMIVELLRARVRLDADTQIRALVAIALVGLGLTGMTLHQTGEYAVRSQGPAVPWLHVTVAGIALLLLIYGVLAVLRHGQKGLATWEHTVIAAGVIVFAGALVVGAGGFDLELAADAGSFGAGYLPQVLIVAVVFGYAWALVARDDRLGAAARVFALTLLVLGAGVALGRTSFVSRAFAGGVAARHSGLDELDDALTSLDEAIIAFLEDTGCYPASLADLAAGSAPETAVDSSGNEIESPDGWAGPYLARLPHDPLTDARDTWVYEVTGSPMIDSGGLAIKLLREDTKAEAPGPLAGVPALPVHPFELDYDRTLEALVDPGTERVVHVPATGTAAFLACPSRHEGFEFRLEERDDLAVSITPDGKRAAFALKSHPAQIRLCDVFAPDRSAEQLDTSGTWVSGREDLLDGSWPVTVHDLAIHPDGQRVAVVVSISGRRLEADATHLTRVYAVDGESPPRPVPGSDGCVEVEWENERDLLGLFGQLPRYQRDPLRTGTLKRIMPDGRTEVLAKDVAPHKWRSGEGWVAATIPGGVNVIHPDGWARTVSLPEPGWQVDDLAIGGGKLCIACGPRIPDRRRGSQRDYAPSGTGRVVEADLGKADLTTLARYTRDVQHSGAGRVLILGTDAATGAWAVALVTGSSNSNIGLFALRPDRVPHRLMPHSADPLMDRAAQVDRTDMKVDLVGLVPESTIGNGDLYAPYDTWGARDRQRKLYGSRGRGRLAHGPPVLGRSEFVLKLRPADEHAGEALAAGE